MSVLENFKNIPRSPSHRATGPKCNFFSSNLQRSPWRKKRGLSPPPTGDRDLSPTPGATGACRPLRGRQGPLRRRMPPFLLWFEPKNSEKKPALAAIPFVIWALKFMKKTGVVAVLSHLFEMVEGHCYLAINADHRKTKLKCSNTNTYAKEGSLHNSLSPNHSWYKVRVIKASRISSSNLG